MKRNVSKVLSVLLIAALMLSFTAVASAETRMYATRAVNVRSGPSTSYYILGSLEQNEMVMATGRVYDGWYEIKWGSYGYAYVAGNYLSYSKYAPGYNPNYNCYPGNRGVPLKVCPDCGDTYYSTTALNVRRGPSTKYSIVGSLNRGQKCTVVGKSGNWYKIQYTSSTVGYIHDSYFTKATSDTGVKSKVVNCNEWVNVRSAATTSSALLGRADLGAEYTFLKIMNNYAMVIYNGRVGCIHKNYVQVG